MIKNIIIYLLLTIVAFGEPKGKGTLNVKTQIIPVSTTKKYNFGKSLILDAGVLNSNSNIDEMPIASVSVRMYTSKNSTDTGDPNGIEGEFNQSFRLKEFESTLNNKVITLGAVQRYKGGESASMSLITKNVRIINEDVRDLNSSKNSYVFVAYPEDAIVGNEVVSLEYTFDLYLKVNGVNKGDIIRQDVTIGKNTNELDAVGSIRDIIKEQFLSLQ